MLWLLVAANEPAAAGWLLLGLGATDWVDGYLARALDQESELGKVLDPLADRLAVAAAVIGGWISGALPWPIALAIGVREGAVGIAALVVAARTRRAIQVRWVGKAGTFGLYGAVAAFFVHAGWGGAFYLWAAWLAVVPGLVLYYLAAILYAGDARAALRESARVSSEHEPIGGDR